MAPAHLPENAPAWVCAAPKAGWPVVVPRAPAQCPGASHGVPALPCDASDQERAVAGWSPAVSCSR
ncbi:hypothetical protein [Pseudomonas aeruginosa]